MKLLSPFLLDLVVQGNSVLDELGRRVQLTRARSKIFSKIHKKKKSIEKYLKWGCRGLISTLLSLIVKIRTENEKERKKEEEVE